MMKVPLDKAGNDEYKSLVDEAGGDVGKIDQGKLSDLITRNAERVRLATEAGKDKRAEIGAQTRIKVADKNNASKTNTPANQQKKAAYETQVNRLKQFNQGLSQTMLVSFDGETYTAGSAKAKAKVAELQKAVNDAKADWESTQQMQPNSSAGQTRHRAYDPNTGTIK